VQRLEERVECLTKQKRNSLAREKRAKKSCKEVVEELKGANFLNAELEGRLEAFKGT